LLGTTGDDTRWGGTVGAGLEFGFAPNWSAGIEYNHLFMQDRTHTFVDTTAPSLGPTGSARTSISSRLASTTALVARASRGTDLLSASLNEPGKAGLVPAFLRVRTAVRNARLGCNAHTFAADVVFRRQPFAMIPRYIRPATSD
jgi:hypothetical protein